jgi:sterol desaturase/sphingolipid hydroxylase (fatty acid hydroxylase superfamily)
MDHIFGFIAGVLDRLSDVILSPTDPSNRIYWLYLLTSAAVAFCVYVAVRRAGNTKNLKVAEDAKGSFLQFLFPKSVWSNPSAWLDVRYAIFHKTVSGLMITALSAFSITLGYRIATGGAELYASVEQGTLLTFSDFAIAAGFMLVLMLVGDFIAWFLHFLQHKVPLLWQFHKVHHSAEVMHPISNFREHPVDNILYASVITFGFGLIYGFAVQIFGFVPSVPMLFGVPAMMFAFNVAGYNLRHSHVWLRWPGVWSKVFPSPAHHHVHHSCHPDHIDKNFAFMFPVWDVVFGTYTMPDDNKDVQFGVPEEQGRNLDGVLNLYLVPFRDAFRLFVPKAEPKKADPAEEARIPAE